MWLETPEKYICFCLGSTLYRFCNAHKPLMASQSISLDTTGTVPFTGIDAIVGVGSSFCACGSVVYKLSEVEIGLPADHYQGCRDRPPAVVGTPRRSPKVRSEPLALTRTDSAVTKSRYPTNNRVCIGILLSAGATCNVGFSRETVASGLEVSFPIKVHSFLVGLLNLEF